jgi:hypothetical protein
VLSTKSNIYGKLSVDAGLLAVIGTSANISDMYPETVTVFPMVIYQDDNQSDGEYCDNKPTISRQRFIVHIFTKLDGPTTTAIGLQVARFFRDEYYDCGSNGEVSEPTEGVRHRVMMFSRELFTSDI